MMKLGVTVSICGIDGKISLAHNLGQHSTEFKYWGILADSAIARPVII